MAHHGPCIIIVGDEEPPAAITYDTPLDRRDSGYVIVMSDRLDDDPDEVPDQAMRPYCSGCVVDQWPDVQTGLAIARQHGTAELDQHGTWQPAA